MNSIDFVKNDFPITTTVLGLMQSALQLVERITGLIGGNYIISGCETVGGSTSAGYVCVNGVVMPFAGGANNTHVRVVTTNTVVNVSDASYTSTTKELVFGTGFGQLLWSTFRRGDDLLDKIDAKADWGNYTTPVQGDVWDFITNTWILGGSTGQISFDGFIPVSARFVIVAIEHYYTQTGTHDWKIRATVSEDDSNSIILRSAYNDHRFESIIVPISGVNKELWIETSAPDGYLRFKITLIGYL